MIVFDLEVRQFSVVDTREYADKKPGFLSNHKVALINTGTTLAGAGVGTMIARKKAKKAAEARGLKPGTPEYKAFVRKQSLKGAAIGAGAGLITGVTGQAAHAAGSNVLAARKEIRQVGIDAGTGPSKMTFKQVRQAAMGNDKYGLKGHLNNYKISNPFKKKK